MDLALNEVAVSTHCSHTSVERQSWQVQHLVEALLAVCTPQIRNSCTGSESPQPWLVVTEYKHQLVTN